MCGVNPHTFPKIGLDVERLSYVVDFLSEKWYIIDTKERRCNIMYLFWCGVVFGISVVNLYQRIRVRENYFKSLYEKIEKGE